MTNEYSVYKCLASVAAIVLFIYIVIKGLNLQKKAIEHFSIPGVNITNNTSSADVSSSEADDIASDPVSSSNISSSEESVSTYAQALDTTIETINNK